MSEAAWKTPDKAPAFSLKNQDEKTVSLDDFAGQWLVLYFYPKDSTPGCTTEACEFTADWSGFERLRAKVVGVSPDSPESHRNFIEKQGLKVELLSDPDHAVLVEYGAWGEKNTYGKVSQGVLRSTVLIDPEGRIVHHWPGVKAAGHAREVAEKLAELQAKLE
jgi:peroxiredoxin Q/BCP